MRVSVSGGGRLRNGRKTVFFDEGRKAYTFLPVKVYSTSTLSHFSADLSITSITLQF